MSEYELCTLPPCSIWGGEGIKTTKPFEDLSYDIIKGSTGQPKLIAHSARFLSNCAVAALERGMCTKSTRYGISDMCAEETPLLCSVISGFYIGHETIVLPRLTTFDVDILRVGILEAMQKHRSATYVSVCLILVFGGSFMVAIQLCIQT